MKKGTFSIVIVPHDLQKTRTYRVQYRLFYAFVAICIVGFVAMVVFVLTYGRLLLKTQETVALERRVEELTARSDQIRALVRNLVQLRAMDLQVRRLLGMELAPGDSVILARAEATELEIERERYDEREQILRSIPSFWPVHGHITRKFDISGGEKDPEYHPGIDISVPLGTPIRAAAAGSVTETGWDDVYGYYVQIDHGYGIKTLYGHSERLVVIRGERIGRGQTLGYTGSTGKSTAPHLHFEVTQNNVHMDPLKYLLQ
ncbi:MAG: M23 family metallopeptidase [bacterium]|nr:MAG: M23 family metallopeptidase [bacterium]